MIGLTGGSVAGLTGAGVAFEVILLVASVLLATWYAHFRKRPNVRLVGSRGGPAAFSIRVANQPRAFRIVESSLFGWRLHRDITIGPVVEPSSVHGLIASLYEKDSKELITHLFWQLSDGRISNEATLASGDEASLLIFNRSTENHRYFVWRPNVEWTGAAPPPVVEAQYSSTREFRIELHDRYGRRKLKFPAKMTLGPDGRLMHSSPVGGGTF